MMTDNYVDIIASRILSLCRKRKITVNKLAGMSGLRQSTVESIVKGISQNPTIKTMHKIATAFNMTLAEFLDFPELNDYSFDDASRDEDEEA